MNLAIVCRSIVESLDHPEDAAAQRSLYRKMLSHLDAIARLLPYLQCHYVALQQWKELGSIQNLQGDRKVLLTIRTLLSEMNAHLFEEAEGSLDLQDVYELLSR